MTNTTEACRDVLNCPICMDTLATPKILPCGHSFCLTCLAEVVKQHDPMCPLCRTPITLPPSGKIEDIATNFSVTGLLEVLEKTEDQVNSTITCNAKRVSNYICLTCLVQVCSCCRLSFHTNNNHKCVSVSEFTEKLQQDVFKMDTVIDKSLLQETERYATALSVTSKYFNLNAKIRTACKEMLQLIRENKLDLGKIKQLQKQVKTDHTKFVATWEVLKQEIRDAKNREEVVKTQLSEYQQKLKALKLPDCVYKNTSISLKISSFEKLRATTEALSKSLTQQWKIKSLDFLTMEASLEDIHKNIGSVEQNIKDFIQDYHTCLLREIDVTGQTVEPHHLFRVLEAVDMLKLGSDRHSEHIMLKCDELIHKLLTSKDFIKTSCTKLFDEFHYMPFELLKTEERVVKIVEEMKNCKEYYEDIYKVIGKHFVIYDNSCIKSQVQNYLLTQDTSFVLQSKAKDTAHFLKMHFSEFESYKQTTKTKCKLLIKYLSEECLDTRVVHEKLKVIEIRIERTEYHYQLLKNVSSIVERCHEISEEFERFLQAKETITVKIRSCFEHKEEVERLWRLVVQHESRTILFDVDVITRLSKSMEERRNNVVSLLMLSNLEVKHLRKRLSKLKRIMELYARLHSRVNEISNRLPHMSCLYHFQEIRVRNLESDIEGASSTTEISCTSKFALQDLLHIVKLPEELNELFEEVRNAFATECNCFYQDALLRLKASKPATSWWPQSEYQKKMEEWKIFELAQENCDQWKTVDEIVKNGSSDANIIEIHIDEAISSYDQLNSARKNIFLEGVKELIALVFALIALYIFVHL